MTDPSRRRVTAIAAVVVFVVFVATAGLAGCTGDEPPPSAAPAPAQAQASAGFAGLYLTDEVTVLEAQQGRLSLVSTMPCADLAGMLVAGQWRRVDQMVIPPGAGAGLLAGFGILPALLLGRDDQLAFAALDGNQCSALITSMSRSPITITGKGLPGTAEGWSAVTRCTAYTKQKSLELSLYFDIEAKAGGLLRILLVPAGGGYAVDTQASEFSAGLLVHHSHVLEVYSEMLANGSDSSVPPDGVTAMNLAQGPQFAGHATLDKPEGEGLPSGRLVLDGLVDDATGDEITLAVPFACQSVSTF